MYSQNKITGKFQLFPVGIACTITGARGRHGQMYDIWWANTYLPDGFKYSDGAGNDDFIKIGCWVFPWPNNIELLKA